MTIIFDVFSSYLDGRGENGLKDHLDYWQVLITLSLLVLKWMWSFDNIVLKLTEVLILAALQGILDYALNMQISKRLSRFSYSIAHIVIWQIWLQALWNSLCCKVNKALDELWWQCVRDSNRRWLILWYLCTQNQHADLSLKHYVFVWSFWLYWLWSLNTLRRRCTNNRILHIWSHETL